MALTLNFRHQGMPQTNREDAATLPLGESESRLRRGLLTQKKRNVNRLSSPPLAQRHESYLMVHTPTDSRFGVSHGSPAQPWLTPKRLIPE